MSRTTAYILYDEDKAIVGKGFMNGPRYSDWKREDGRYECIRGNRDKCLFQRVEKYDSPYGDGWSKRDVENKLMQNELVHFDFEDIPWHYLGSKHSMEIAKQKFKNGTN